MVKQRWDCWTLLRETVTTSYFGVMAGYKLSVYRLIQAIDTSLTFKCLNMSMINDWVWLRLLDFIVLINHHHTPTFESQVVTILVPGPYVTHQD
eukprot:scaffold58006_cov96-Cyclotella_meneghiniana.AAC.1